MNIIQRIDSIVTEQLHMQKLREDSIKSKKEEVIKYNKMSKMEKERIEEITKEIKETSLQIVKLLEIKKQLEEVNCVTA